MDLAVTQRWREQQQLQAQPLCHPNRVTRRVTSENWWLSSSWQAGVVVVVVFAIIFAVVVLRMCGGVWSDYDIVTKRFPQFIYLDAMHFAFTLCSSTASDLCCSQ